jgi:hypothetical protein
MSESTRANGNGGRQRRLESLANSALLALASRLALLVVAGVLGWMTSRFVATLDDITKDAAELAKNVAVISATVSDHARRLEKIEGKVFR